MSLFQHYRARYGVTVSPEQVAAVNPRLIYASISGFGQTGPYRDRAAYDVVVQAMSGMMSLTGHPGGPPTRAGTSIGDLGAALFACNGIQAALLQRARTGLGCHVDVAMLEAQIALLEGAVAHTWAHGEPPGPTGARHPGSAPFDAFRAADGYLVIAAGSDRVVMGRNAEMMIHDAWGIAIGPAADEARIRASIADDVVLAVGMPVSAVPAADRYGDGVVLWSPGRSGCCRRTSASWIAGGSAAPTCSSTRPRPRSPRARTPCAASASAWLNSGAVVFIPSTGRAA